MHEHTTAASYAVSGFTIWAGTIDWNTVSMVGGLILGVLTFALNAWYKHKNRQDYLKALARGVVLHAPKD